MQLQNPKVTIVTVVRNAEKLIEKTINSVIEQDYAHIEYIVIDGDSQDNTKLIIQKYIHHISKYISEADQGIYDAMNKAAKLASGDWILYMNAGDCFYAPNSLSSLADALNSDTDVVLAGVEEVLVDNLETRYFQRMPQPVEEIWRYMPTSHQATIVRLSCQKEYGFDTSYTWCADHDLLARLYRDGKKFFSQNILFCVFDCSSGSSRELMLYIHERWRLSKGLVPFYHRLIQYGSEWISYKIFGKLVVIIKSFLPKSIILQLRRFRGTSGIKAS
ncbi:glycosyltransferase [Anabaena minutissima FACHB-250]|nr:glycosyltransferase [Anabaena minutissima FACHB-250]